MTSSDTVSYFIIRNMLCISRSDSVMKRQQCVRFSIIIRLSDTMYRIRHIKHHQNYIIWTRSHGDHMTCWSADPVSQPISILSSRRHVDVFETHTHTHTLRKVIGAWIQVFRACEWVSQVSVTSLPVWSLSSCSRGSSAKTWSLRSASTCARSPRGTSPSRSGHRHVTCSVRNPCGFS